MNHCAKLSPTAFFPGSGEPCFSACSWPWQLENRRNSIKESPLPVNGGEKNTCVIQKSEELFAVRPKSAFSTRGQRWSRGRVTGKSVTSSALVLSATNPFFTFFPLTPHPQFCTSDFCRYQPSRASRWEVPCPGQTDGCAGCVQPVSLTKAAL